jgi:hypothetical protein
MLHLVPTRLAGATSPASSRTTVDSRRRRAHCPTDLLHLVLEVFYYPAPIREQRTPPPFLIVTTHRPHSYLCPLASEASRRDVPCAFFPKNVARAAIKGAALDRRPCLFSSLPKDSAGVHSQRYSLRFILHLPPWSNPNRHASHPRPRRTPRSAPRSSLHAYTSADGNQILRPAPAIPAARASRRSRRRCTSRGVSACCAWLAVGFTRYGAVRQARRPCHPFSYPRRASLTATQSGSILVAALEFDLEHGKADDDAARVLLGAHAWPSVLATPQPEYAGAATRVFRCVLESDAALAREGWRRVDLGTTTALGDHEMDGRTGEFATPWPRPTWCAPPPEDATCAPLCRPLRRSDFADMGVLSAASPHADAQEPVVGRSQR